VIWASLVVLVALGAAPVPAQGDYVRDELRINMRSGPGVQYRIVKLLRSGDKVERLAEQEDWIQVRLGEGEEGWVPAGYLTVDPPPSVALPRLQARMRESRARVKTLEEKLEAQSEEVLELETLRGQVKELRTENIRLSGSTRWKELATGGGIVLIGMLIGALLAKTPRSRSRRLKL
jgi:SH3 domain protein